VASTRRIRAIRHIFALQGRKSCCFEKSPGAAAGWHAPRDVGTFSTDSRVLAAMKKQLLIAVLASAFTLGAAHAQVVVRVGPPAPIVEAVPPPPPEHPGWAWHSGYHRWDGERYVWVPGVYEAPPHPGGVWVAGRWVSHGGGYVWREGHWR
jgi:hypothetical protein